MVKPVKPFWLQITYSCPRGRRAETHMFTGTSLHEVLDDIAINQRGRLKYNPKAPRILRISAIRTPALSESDAAMVDEIMRLVNNPGTVNA